MRVLHVYSGNLFGGIETALVTLARHQTARPAMQHEVALCFDGRLRQELDAAAIRVHRLPSPRASRPHTVTAARHALAELLARDRFDRVICHAVWPLALFGGIVKRAGAPLVFWAHDASTGRHWTERWARRIRPDLVIANSRYTARSLTAIYPDVQPAIVRVPVAPPAHPVTVTERGATRRALDTPADAVVVVQASRMEAWKGHSTLIDALARLPRDAPWTCWMIGGAQRRPEREYERALRDLARRRGLADRVRFVGERSDVPRVLAAGDIYCQPNARPEPFGIVFVEALYAARPVVASNAGGAAEIVDDSCGRLVPSSDPAALAAALHPLVDDAALRAQLGAAGPARARMLCDPAAQVRALHQALARLDVPAIAVS